MSIVMRRIEEINNLYYKKFTRLIFLTMEQSVRE